MIYIIKEAGRPLYKIGYTRDRPEQRIKELQTGNSDKIVVIARFEGTRADEAHLHELLAEYRVRPDGEWFELDTRRLLSLFVNHVFGEERIIVSADRGVVQENHFHEFLKEFHLSTNEPDPIETSLSEAKVYALYCKYCLFMNVDAIDDRVVGAKLHSYGIGYKKVRDEYFYNMRVKASSRLEGE